MKYPVTPDGRYMVVKDRLWRVANPHIAADQRALLVRKLMEARREVKAALTSGDKIQLTKARNAVNDAKVALGERGPVWWQDGSKDFNRYLIKNTPYLDWYQQLNQREKNS
ncbi:MAG: hypothetical protein R3341_01760 [Methylophaga sp.]|nr:hypothetical protein [Methylophaga sp.]